VLRLTEACDSDGTESENTQFITANLATEEDWDRTMERRAGELPLKMQSRTAIAAQLPDDKKSAIKTPHAHPDTSRTEFQKKFENATVACTEFSVTATIETPLQLHTVKYRDENEAARR
jgi:hypothetical protein